MPGANCTRSLACESDKAHEHSHHRFRRIHPTFPAQWFYGLLRALLGDHAFLTPSPALLIADLTPTIWGVRTHDFAVRNRPRSSRALPASTASRSTLMTLRQRPSIGTGQRESVN